MAIASQTGSGFIVPDPPEKDILPGGGVTGEALVKRTDVDADVWWQAGPAAVIADNSVGSAKLAQIATKSFLGRTSALTGNVEAVPAATLKTDLALGNVADYPVASQAEAEAGVSTTTYMTPLRVAQAIAALGGGGGGTGSGYIVTDYVATDYVV